VNQSIPDVWLDCTLQGHVAKVQNDHLMTRTEPLNKKICRYGIRYWRVRIVSPIRRRLYHVSRIPYPVPANTSGTPFLINSLSLSLSLSLSPSLSPIAISSFPEHEAQAVKLRWQRHRRCPKPPESPNLLLKSTATNEYQRIIFN
jgi:hypothetical protein